MEELVKKAQLTLNVLLLGSLILGWSNYKKPANVLDNVARIYEICSSIPNLDSSTLLPNTQLFVAVYRRNLDDESDQFENISIGQIFAIEEELPKIKIFFKSKSFKSDSATANALIKNDQFLAQIEDLDSLKKAFNQRPLLYTVSEEMELKDHIDFIKNYRELFNSPLNTPVSSINKQIKTFIELPIINEKVNTDIAILLISVFVIGPLLLFLSISKTISDNIKGYKDNISWIFFHSGKLGLILGIIQVFMPFLATLYVISIGRLKLVYILPVTLVVLFLGILCTKEILKARKNFYSNS